MYLRSLHKCEEHVSLLSVLLLPRISRLASSSSSHYHFCCCCRCCCYCSCVLMVLLRCGQPWCLTSSAPPAHLLAAGLPQPALHAQALALFTPNSCAPGVRIPPREDRCGAGAAAAALAAEAEAAWCSGTGGGAGGTSHCS